MIKLCLKKIWVKENFLNIDLLKRFQNVCDQNDKKEISDLTAHALVGHAPFHYYLVNAKINPSDIISFWQALDLVLMQTGHSISTSSNKANPPYFAAKVFVEKSHYGLHAEPSQLFGSLSYVLFLSDETDMDLYFPSQTSIRGKLLDLSHWTQFKNSFATFNESLDFASDVSIAPKVNRLVLFNPQLAHTVQKTKIKRLEKHFRKHISGWPYAQDLRNVFRMKNQHGN